MTLQYCSDLHLEFDKNKKYMLRHPLAAEGDILILAGDIVPFTLLDDHADFFDEISNNFRKVYWLPGNHEYYGFDIMQKPFNLHETIRENVFLVNNTVIDIDDVQLIFSTLWSQLSPVNFSIIQSRLADFSAINFNEQILTPGNYNELHQQSKQFLLQAIEHKPASKKIVVTHHVPTFLNYPVKYKKDILNEAFATELYNEVEMAKIDYWIYGHHHVNTPAFFIGKTELVTNQLGYIKYRQNGGFRKGAAILV